MEEYFKVPEGKTTYLCRKTEKGFEVLGHYHYLKANAGWVRYRKPHPWHHRPSNKRAPLEWTPITKAQVTAIFLMARRVPTI